MVRVGFMVLVGLLLAVPGHAQHRVPTPGQTWAQANPKDPVARPSRRELVLRRELRKARTKPKQYAALQAPAKKREGLQDLLNDEIAQQPELPVHPSPAAPLPAALPPLSAEDQALAGKLGLNPQTGQQTNAAQRALNLEIDSWVGYVRSGGRITVGPSLVLLRRGNLKANVDAAEDFVGLSFNYELAPVVCPAIGCGYGYDVDRSTFSLYGKASFKVW